MDATRRRLYEEFITLDNTKRQVFLSRLGEQDPGLGEVLNAVYDAVQGAASNAVGTLNRLIDKYQKDPFLLSLLYFALGIQYVSSGNLQGALYANLMFLEKAEEADYTPGVLKALANIAGVHLMMEDPAGAKPYLSRLTGLLREVKDTKGVFGALAMLSCALMYEGDPGPLLQVAERMEGLATRPSQKATVLEIKGTAKLLEGDVHGALETLWEGVSVARNDMAPNVLSNMLLYSDLALFAGRLGDEIDALVSMARFAEDDSKHRFRKAYLISLRANALARKGDVKGALAQSLEAGKMFTEANEHLLAYSCYLKALVFAWQLRDPVFFEVLSRVAPKAQIYRLYLNMPILGDFLRGVMELDRRIGAMTKEPRLRVWLLGEFKMEMNGKVITADQWRNKKALQLFWHLLLSPGSYLSYDEIASLLWPHERLSKTYARIRVAVSYIRDMMGPAARHLVTKRSLGYRITMGPCIWVDLWELEELVRKAPVMRVHLPDGFRETKERVAELYRGPLLPGVKSPQIITRREYVQGRVRALLEEG